MAMFENPFWFSSASLQSVSNLKAEGADQKALLELVDSNVSRANLKSVHDTKTWFSFNAEQATVKAMVVVVAWTTFAMSTVRTKS